jgi:phosphoglycerate kinase
MIFTFYKARGLKTGKSMVEEDKLDLAKKLEAMAKAKGVELILPVDVIIADKFDANANDKVGLPGGFSFITKCRGLGAEQRSNISRSTPRHVPMLMRSSFLHATQVVDIDSIPDEWMGLDIGPKSLEIFNAALADAKTVVWNGPMASPAYLRHCMHGFRHFLCLAAFLLVLNRLVSLATAGCV